MSICIHENEITDLHEGTIVCVDCGIVKDVFYVNNEKSQYLQSNNYLGQVENILEYLHLPQQFSERVILNLQDLGNKKKFNISKQKNYDIKKVVSEIYNTVNSEDSCILLKDILNLTQLSTKQIKSKNISLLNIDQTLEKYTKRFNLNFQNCSLIKEEILKYNNTGFQPLTVVGGVIYSHLKNIKLKKPMKYIAEVLGISAISIQRFIKYKNAISSRN